MSEFVAELNKDIPLNPDQSVFSTIWEQYERVIMESLITSFGLDFLVQDQYGGDVDTIHNVREIGKDANMFYKNPQNQKNYENRGEYNSSEYHGDIRYREINKRVSENKKNGILQDAYTGKTVARNAKIDLDHVVAAKEIHDDRGRILAGLSGTELANCKENLKPTDKSINRSMGQQDMNEYLSDWKEKQPQRQNRINELKSQKNLTDKERKELNKLEKFEEIDAERMAHEGKMARTAYDKKISREYYTDQSFLKDSAKATGKQGIAMMRRQAIGYVFLEIWLACKKELQSLPVYKDLKDMLEAVANGVKRGVENARSKWKEIMEKCGEGFTSGVLASLTTTLCNIFFTTTKNVVRNIRQITASVVQATKVLLFNPDNLMFGDRIKTVTIILATGANVLIGTAVGALIGKTPLGEMFPGVETFCATLVSGLLSCTLLVFLDRSKFMNAVINGLNGLAAVVDSYRRIADALEEIAAKLAKIDIAQFKAETAKYSKIASKIKLAKNQKEINGILLAAYKELDIKIPWKGDFDTFMGDKSNQLVFE